MSSAELPEFHSGAPNCALGDSASPQTQPSEVNAPAPQPDAHGEQSASAHEPLSKNQEILAFLDEWMKEPDELGPEWWARFDEELKATRLHFPERDLP
jgi:hypothetical protein